MRLYVLSILMLFWNALLQAQSIKQPFEYLSFTDHPAIDWMQEIYEPELINDITYTGSNHIVGQEVNIIRYENSFISTEKGHLLLRNTYEGHHFVDRRSMDSGELMWRVSFSILDYGNVRILHDISVVDDFVYILFGESKGLYTNKGVAFTFEEDEGELVLYKLDIHTGEVVDRQLFGQGMYKLAGSKNDRAIYYKYNNASNSITINRFFAFSRDVIRYDISEGVTLTYGDSLQVKSADVILRTSLRDTDVSLRENGNNHILFYTASSDSNFIVLQEYEGLNFKNERIVKKQHLEDGNLRIAFSKDYIRSSDNYEPLIIEQTDASKDYYRLLDNQLELFYRSYYDTRFAEHAQLNDQTLIRYSAKHWAESDSHWLYFSKLEDGNWTEMFGLESNRINYGLQVREHMVLDDNSLLLRIAYSRSNEPYDYQHAWLKINGDYLTEISK